MVTWSNDAYEMPMRCLPEILHTLNILYYLHPLAKSLIMAAWTPIIFDLSEHCHLLYSLIENSLDQLWSEPGTLSRSKVLAWKFRIKERIETHKNNEELVRGF